LRHKDSFGKKQATRDELSAAISNPEFTGTITKAGFDPDTASL
jgi:hypothetical protein